MKQKPILSAVIPIFNAENTIDRCIKSILNQSYTEFELILVNDGSQDNSEQLCKNYLYDCRVILINKINGGVSSARNKGIEAAQGEYIVFIDSDDYTAPDCFEVMINSMLFYKADLFISGFGMDKNGKIHIQKSITTSLFNKIYSIDEFEIPFRELFLGNYINSPWAKCYKKRLINTFFNENFNLGEDFLFNLCYLENCDSIYISDRILYYYCFLENSLSNMFSVKSCNSLYGVYIGSKYAVENIWGRTAWPKDEIDKKYISDFVTIIERWIRTENPLTDEIIELIQKYDLYEVFKRCTISEFSRKNDLERRLILNHQIFCLKIIAIFSCKLKRILRTIYKAIQEKSID